MGDGLLQGASQEVGGVAGGGGIAIFGIMKHREESLGLLGAYQLPSWCTSPVHPLWLREREAAAAEAEIKQLAREGRLEEALGHGGATEAGRIGGAHRGGAQGEWGGPVGGDTGFGAEGTPSLRGLDDRCS